MSTPRTAPEHGQGRTVLARVLPPSAIPSSRLRHVVHRDLLTARQWWLTVVSGFFEPVFYLFSLGVGLGALVGDVTWAGVEVSYVQFVAPGLLAASAMNGAFYESTMNVYAKMTLDRAYDAMLATPMQPGDVAGGEITYSQLRGTAYSLVFLLVLWAFGYVASPWGVLALPAAMLLGFAFSALGMATTTFMRSWTDMDLVATALLPLFLLSTTFYPLEVYPAGVRPLILLSPLYHGVELVRAATLGIADWSILGHVVVLLVVAVSGTVLAGRRLESLLLR
jgi:lipooligosaccharide transport system permease protein